MSPPDFLRAQPDGLFLSVKVQPRASKNEVGPSRGGELKIYVTAPPVDSAANEALIELLADKLDCGRSQFEIIRGHKSRHKVLRLFGLEAPDVMKKLGSESD